MKLPEKLTPMEALEIMRYMWGEFKFITKDEDGFIGVHISKPVIIKHDLEKIAAMGPVDVLDLNPYDWQDYWQGESEYVFMSEIPNDLKNRIVFTEDWRDSLIEWKG